MKHASHSSDRLFYRQLLKMGGFIFKWLFAFVLLLIWSACLASSSPAYFHAESISIINGTCNESIPYIEPIITESENHLSLKFRDTFIVNDDCFKLIERKFIAVDRKGESYQFQQFIYLTDTSSPSFIGAEEEISRPTNDYNDLYVEALDECSKATITFEDEVFSESFNKKIIRTYSAQDACGNTSLFRQIIHLIDSSSVLADIEGNMKFYPNPTSDWTSLSFKAKMDGKAIIVISDLTGLNVAQVYSEEVKANEEYFFSFDFSEVKTGVYILQMINETELERKRILIKR